MNAKLHIAPTVKPAVVIPVYKINLNLFEEISLNRHITILKDYDCFLLIPQKLSAHVNHLLARNEGDNNRVSCHVVDDLWLSSHRHYNQLMLRREFYQFYEFYSHILVAQLDSYTFEDRLLAWCNTKYDYVGAPIYNFGSHWQDDLLCVGNGGFSLRKVASFISALDANPVIFTLDDLVERLKPYNAKGKFVNALKYAPCWLMRGNRLREECNSLAYFVGVNEDLCYAKYLPAIRNDFLIPSYVESVSFCIDSHVTRELKVLKEGLPFGAHGWWTWNENLDAWRPFIRELNCSSFLGFGGLS